MAQLTLYIPDDLEKELKKAARRAKKSVSAYVVGLTAHQLQPRRWSKAFLATYGSWNGAVPEVEKLEFEKRERF